MIKISANLVKKIVSFTFWGILTTALNVGLYYGFRLLTAPVLLSTVLAWFLCVLFAFITNKKYVFNSKTVTKKAILRECLLFYGSRLFSGLMDVGIMFLLVEVLHLNEIFSKITDEIIVSAFNFLISFIFIFKEKKPDAQDSIDSAML